jgi:UDP-N-acetylglucosamine 2-epimerase (non-hydrolysing)
MKKKILVVFGTRPEAVKLAPLITALRTATDAFETRVCVTAQHREMLDQVLSFFSISPEYDLNIMQPGQTLFDVTTASLNGVRAVLEDWHPDWIIVQGDTTTVFAASLAAFYCDVRVAHVEAGLRSFQKRSPFPEEINRVLTSHIADIHFAPTPLAAQNLIREGIAPSSVFTVGNTVIDALLMGIEKVHERRPEEFGTALQGLHEQDYAKKIILVTGHRRESFGEPFQHICQAIRTLSERDDTVIVYPVHLNPNVRKPVFDLLSGLKNVRLIDPLEYPAFIWLMNKSHLILTDSGGIQEEAPSLGKPVLVMRTVTERTEGIEAGTALLVGTDAATIVRETTLLLDDHAWYNRMSGSRNPYGDGTTSQQIVEILKTWRKD